MQTDIEDIEERVYLYRLFQRHIAEGRFNWFCFLNIEGDEEGHEDEGRSDHVRPGIVKDIGKKTAK